MVGEGFFVFSGAGVRLALEVRVVVGWTPDGAGSVSVEVALCVGVSVLGSNVVSEGTGVSTAGVSSVAGCVVAGGDVGVSVGGAGCVTASVGVGVTVAGGGAAVVGTGVPVGGGVPVAVGDSVKVGVKVGVAVGGEHS